MPFRFGGDAVHVYLTINSGFAPWTEFELKTFEVTVYHPDLLPSESAAALGDPVRSGVAPA